MSACSIEGCEGRRQGNGLCGKHYRRWQRTGSTADPTPRRPRDPIEKIADRVALDEDGCLIWLGPIGPSGYGRVNVGSKADGSKRNTDVYRLLYVLLNGPVPTGLQLDHLCRNRRCCHPDHLEPVTQRENLLRGDTIPARYAARTHCKHGHEYTPENTAYRRGSNARVCRACRRARKRAAK